ncbi:MAG: type IX secretion system sortase PorU [Bacteroidales bacterium]|nr:type IX secretion system sortase PorU [Bacteroidales bacterium]
MFIFFRNADFPVRAVNLTDAHYEPLNGSELQSLGEYRTSLVPVTPELTTEVVYNQGKPMLKISLVPLRRNTNTGLTEKLMSFNVVIEYDSQRELKTELIADYASSSALSAGDWYKVSIAKTGIYQLSYTDLASMGVQVNGLSSSKIRVHGYGGGMLPERAGAARYDDLPEVPLMVMDGGDGIFNEGDYLLFYARGPMKWSFNAQSGLFEHQPHLYADVSYCFITTGEQDGHRVQEIPQPSTSATAVVDTYNWFEAYHPNDVNLIKSGREWYGDVFDIVSERDYPFTGFEPQPSMPATVRLSAAARSVMASSFTLKAGGSTFSLFISPIVTEFNTAYARVNTETFIIDEPDFSSGFNLKFNKPTGSALGWLNYLELNALARLSFGEGQTSFRRSGQQGVVEYRISDVTTPFLLWDVTDPIQPGYINVTASGGQVVFKALADTLREYIICDGQGYLKPVFVEKVANQNLHALVSYDMVLVAHPDFAQEAARLATFHSQKNNFNVLVVQPQAIYNEFSSGMQDISAIRDFIRMYWKRSQGSPNPRFLLLFGDASYDPKNRQNNNSNFIPTFQSPESLHPVTSYVTDDFFGCLDDNEGGLSSDVPDIGIGRLPVQTAEEATMAVDKIIHYVTETEKVNGDWRNVITFVADDGDNGDGNVHMQQADMLATLIDTTYRSYNLDKIFFDAYPQVSTPGGQRIPDASAAINQRMDKGALIVNYTGHGGEVGWAHERVLEMADIKSWTNYDRLPVFMTATCEFSRYDDPAMQSAGELVFLNANGGGIALFTTSRPTFGTPNFSLSRSFYDIAFKRINNEMPYLGDLIRLSKLSAGADNNSKKFVLLGDPAMKMAYPEFLIQTLQVNGRDISEVADTLKALSEITISGIITDFEGNLLSDFNGEVIPTVFDKAVQIETFGSAGSSPFTFSLRRNIIHKGKVNVSNGAFTFSFIVPRDIAYQYGTGKISYYATDGQRDAAGFYDGLVVGGFSDRQLDDLAGPEIELFMNDRNFRNGGFTNENPVMLADLKDFSGINTIGNGIGHDIVAILDEKTDNPFILNEFYQSDLDTYKSGVINFPFHNLSPGYHTVRLKVWDVNNNSSEVSTGFVVATSDGLTLGSFEAWPNPMTDNITFAIEHNQAGQVLDAQLDIYTLSGQKAASFSSQIYAEGYRTAGFEWDGRSSDGHPLSNGFYVGRIRIKTSSGLVSEKSVKVVIAR